MTKVAVTVVTYAVSKQSFIICQMLEKKNVFETLFQNCNFFLIKTNTEICLLIKKLNQFCVLCVAVTYLRK